jgi:predicted nucleotidyltransferase
MKDQLKTAIDQILLEILQENPDTVSDKDGTTLAYYQQGPAVAFIGIKDPDTGEIEFLTKDTRGTTRAAYHSDLGNYSNYAFRGRVWTDLKICSFYQPENVVMPFSKDIEGFFNRLGIDIKTIGFEFGDSAETKGLVKWPGNTSNRPQIKISPDIEKKINDLMPKFHLASGDEKERLRKELDALYKQAGVENAKEAEFLAYVKDIGKKFSPYEKGGGSLAGYRHGRGINEKKVRIYNHDLCPDVWVDKNTIDPELRNHLLKIATDFFKDADLNVQYSDILLLGSAANYNWTPESDLDVHILVDSDLIKIHPEQAQKFFYALSKKWNLEHDIKMKGHKVEIYLQDTHEKNAAEAVYSILRSEWVKRPCPEKITVDKAGIQKKYSMWVERINDAIKSEDDKKMKAVVEGLHDARQAGLTKAGEFSTENLVFKILRSRGFVKKLKDAETTTYDKKMAVNEQDYIGTTYLGVVKAQPTSNAHKKIHNDSGMISGINSENWRYISKKNTVLWNTEPTEEHKQLVTAWLEKQGISNPIHKVMYTYNEGFDPLSVGPNPEATEGNSNADFYKNHIKQMRQMEEVGMKNLKSRHPQVSVMHYGNEFEKLTLDNLKALRDKATRFYQAAKSKHDEAEMENSKAWFVAVSQEMKRRLDYINKPTLNENGGGAGGASFVGGYGTGKRKDDRLAIHNGDGSLRRWQIRSKDAPKTPKMPGMKEIADAINREAEELVKEALSEMFSFQDTTLNETIKELKTDLLLESPQVKTLKANKKPLTDEERSQVMQAKAVWHHSPSGEETPAVWKAMVKGKTWYCCNTHRAIQINPTLKGAIKAFEFIKTTA